MGILHMGGYLIKDPKRDHKFDNHPYLEPQGSFGSGDPLPCTSGLPDALGSPEVGPTSKPQIVGVMGV